MTGLNLNKAKELASTTLKNSWTQNLKAFLNRHTQTLSLTMLKLFSQLHRNMLISLRHYKLMRNTVMSHALQTLVSARETGLWTGLVSRESATAHLKTRKPPDKLEEMLTAPFKLKLQLSLHGLSSMQFLFKKPTEPTEWNLSQLPKKPKRLLKVNSPLFYKTVINNASH